MWPNHTICSYLPKPLLQRTVSLMHMNLMCSENVCHSFKRLFHPSLLPLQTHAPGKTNFAVLPKLFNKPIITLHIIYSIFVVVTSEKESVWQPSPQTPVKNCNSCQWKAHTLQNVAVKKQYFHSHGFDIFYFTTRKRSIPCCHFIHPPHLITMSTQIQMIASPSSLVLHDKFVSFQTKLLCLLKRSLLKMKL